MSVSTGRKVIPRRKLLLMGVRGLRPTGPVWKRSVICHSLLGRVSIVRPVVDEGGDSDQRFPYGTSLYLFFYTKCVADWPDRMSLDTDKHLDILKMRAVQLALISFQGNILSHTLVLMSDNALEVVFQNNQGRQY